MDETTLNMWSLTGTCIGLTAFVMSALPWVLARRPAGPAARATWSSGTPLTDEDRRPWLESLAAWTGDQQALGRGTIVTCSALKRAYRDLLRQAAPDTFFVHLYGAEDLLRERMEGRDHFMPVSLLRSQFEALEPLEPDESGVGLDVAAPVDEVCREALAVLRAS